MPYASEKQRRYMESQHPEIAARWREKGHAFVKKTKPIQKNRGEGWLKPVIAGTLAGGLANQFPRVQDIERDHRKKKKGRVKKFLYEEHVHSDDPQFNHDAARKTFDLVMKMDDDSAQMFTLMAMGEIYETTIEKNQRTLQRHLDEVISKRLEMTKEAVLRTIAKGNHDGLEEAVAALELIEKAVVNPYIAGLYDFKESDFKRDPHSGQFRSKIKHKQSVPFKGDVADQMGLRPTKKKDLKRYKNLTRAQKAQYQDEYRQLSSFLNVVAQAGDGGMGEHNIKLRLEDQSNGNEFRVEHNTGSARDADKYLLDPQYKLIEVDATPAGLTAGGAAYSLAHAMGAQPGDRTAGKIESTNAAVAGMKGFREDWEKPGQLGATNDRLYNRVGAAGQYIGDVAPDSSTKVQAAARLAEVVGSHGAEAEAVIGPTARRTAYRYRGVEKKPDEHIVTLYERAINGAKRQGKQTPLSQDDIDAQRYAARVGGRPGLTLDEAAAPGADVSTRRATTVRGAGGGETPLAPMQMAARRVVAEARPPTWAERADGARVIREQLRTTLPQGSLYSLQVNSGNLPPSQGILLNKDGQIVTQAVGYGDDHYLPFNLKNLQALKGGEYIRTRSVGGLTSEDIYTGLATGARQVTVVSRSGTFTVEFDETFRGGRRYNDKALRMTRRYEQILDAVQSNQVKRGAVPAPVAQAIRNEVAADYPWERSRTVINQKVKERTNEYRQDPSFGPEDEKILNFVYQQGIREDPSRDALEWSEAAKDMVMEGKQLNYTLDAQGYEAAQDALAEQFPYYIKSHPNIKREGRAPSSEKDKGYVEPARVRATALQGGLYGTKENQAEGKEVGSNKYSQSNANYQRGRYGPAKNDISPAGRLVRARPTGTAAAPAADPAAPDPAAAAAATAAAAAAAAGTPAAGTPAAGAAAAGFAPPGTTPAVAPVPAAAPGTPAATPGTPAATPGTPATTPAPTAAADPNAPNNAVRATIEHENAALELFTQVQRDIDPAATERTTYADILNMTPDTFVTAWQTDEAHRTRFDQLVRALEPGLRDDPKGRAYWRAQAAAVSPVASGPGLATHWLPTPQTFTGLGYRREDSNDDRLREVSRLDRRSRSVTTGLPLSELAARGDRAMELEHNVLRNVHTEMRINPRLGDPDQIDEKGKAIERAFQGAPPTAEAAQLFNTSSLTDLTDRMQDLQKMRAIKANYQGDWPFGTGSGASGRGGAAEPEPPEGNLYVPNFDEMPPAPARPTNEEIARERPNTPPPEVVHERGGRGAPGDEVPQLIRLGAEAYQDLAEKAAQMQSGDRKAAANAYLREHERVQKWIQGNKQFQTRQQVYDDIWWDFTSKNMPAVRDKLLQTYQLTDLSPSPMPQPEADW